MIRVGQVVLAANDRIVMADSKNASIFDEMAGPDGTMRNAYRSYNDWLVETPTERLVRKHEQADILFRRLGITFTVYGEEEGTERLIPFDVIPRILDAQEWEIISTGVCQRVDAINACSAPGSLDTSLSHAAGLIEIAACHA